MFQKGCFDFRGRESVAGNIDNVVYTATDPVISFMVSTSAISSELDSSMDN